MRRFFAAATLVLAFVLSLGITFPGAAAFAQQDNIPSATNRLTVGDILEVMAVTSDVNPEFGWVLTKNNELMEAGREKIFRTRLLETGTYVLDANARTADGDKRVILTIVVAPPDDMQEEPEQPTGLDVVTTDPPMLQGILPVTPESPIVALTPAPFITGGLTLDSDTTADSDGDGIPSNDNDAAETFFAEEHNTLHLWYVNAENAGAMLLSGETEDGTQLSQRIQVAGEALAPGADIIATDKGLGTVSFELPLDTTIPVKNIVIAWDFGDGRRSLVDTPKHTYAFDDEYEVRAVVRELQTGRVLFESALTISVSGTIGLSSSSSSSATSKPATSSSSSISSQPSGGGSSSSMLMLIIRILLIGGLAIVVGVIALWAGKKFLKREGSLQKTLEEAEKKLLGKDAPQSDAPPPMELKRAKPATDEPAPMPAEDIEKAVSDAKAEEASKPEPPAPPATAEVPAPAWLEKGLSAAAAAGQTPNSPPPASITEPAPVPVLQPAPLADVPAVQELPTEPAAKDIADALPESELLPPWMREEQTKTDAAAPAVAPIAESALPVTALPVEPTPPEPTPVPAPVEPQPMPQPAPAPAPVVAPITESALPVESQPAVEPPVTPLPIIDTPIAPPPEPTPVPVAPIATPAPAPQLPSPAPAPVTSDDAARLERERERKRKKRQRYRENLKKRKTEEAPARTPAPTTPIAPSPELPISPSPKPPTPQPSPVPQDIPPLTPDDSVAFIVRAESVEKQEDVKKKGPQTPAA